MTQVRLQKALSIMGLASRRQAERWIEEGRLRLRGEVAVLGSALSPGDVFEIDGQSYRFEGATDRRLCLLNKPTGYVSTRHDPQGRPIVFDLLDKDYPWIQIGRLDYASHGLMVFTTDGALAHRWMHPRFELERTYHVRVVLSPEAPWQVLAEEGVYDAGQQLKMHSIRLLRRQGHHQTFECILKTGLNREIRRAFAALGGRVVDLQRVSYGPLVLGTLPLGASRWLSEEETTALEAFEKARGLL